MKLLPCPSWVRSLLSQSGVVARHGTPVKELALFLRRVATARHDPQQADHPFPRGPGSADLGGRQPVPSTCRYPLITRRSSILGRPGRPWGRCGSIRAQLASDSQYSRAIRQTRLGPLKSKKPQQVVRVPCREYMCGLPASFCIYRDYGPGRSFGNLDAITAETVFVLHMDVMRSTGTVALVGNHDSGLAPSIDRVVQPEQRQLLRSLGRRCGRAARTWRSLDEMRLG